MPEPSALAESGGGTDRPVPTAGPESTVDIESGSGPDDSDRLALSIEILTTAPAPLRRRAVRAWLAEQGVSGLMNAHLQAIDELVSNWRGQGPVAIGGGSRAHRLVVLREHGTLTVRAQPRFDAT
ncbi:TilS substrate-binding domain-containing protein [Nocardia caishijiensis]|uniref:TilS substrate-binding domain-containing protein n=1 Tax=Nocardia caishijiensis TaxID=184756 RepID=UPI001F02EB87|nr:TilS substrate-binding domain-containing protein [Nocardia caishijiensis]